MINNIQLLTTYAYNPTTVSLSDWKELLLTEGFTRDEIKTFGKLNVKKTYVEFTRNKLNITVMESTANYRKTTKSNRKSKKNRIEFIIESLPESISNTELALSGECVSQDILDIIYDLQRDGDVTAGYLVDRFVYRQEVDDIERITPYNDVEGRYFTDNELGITTLLNALYGDATIPAIFLNPIELPETEDDVDYCGELPVIIVNEHSYNLEPAF